MDSKGKRIGILIVLCTMLVIMAAVAAVNYNRLMGKDKKTSAAGSTESISTQLIEADGKVHGADL